MNKKYFVIIFLLIGFVIATTDAVYKVNVEEVVLITQFGEVIGSPKLPGLYFKIPFIQEAHHYPGRIIFRWNEKTFNFKTLDKKDIQISPNIQWMINDAIQFHMEVRYVENTTHRIEGSLYPTLLNYFGSKMYSEIEENCIIKTKDWKLLGPEIIDQITVQLKSSLDKFGIKIYKLEIQIK